jgi:hypothetical protein
VKELSPGGFFVTKKEVSTYKYFVRLAGESSWFRVDEKQAAKLEKGVDYRFYLKQDANFDWFLLDFHKVTIAEGVQYDKQMAKHQPIR